MSFTIKQPNENSIKRGLPLVFGNSIYLLNISIDSLIDKWGENAFFSCKSVI